MKTKAKKQKFEMEIVRTRREGITVTVMAETEEEAFEKALEKADSKKVVWELIDEDYDSSGPYSHP